MRLVSLIFSTIAVTGLSIVASIGQTLHAPPTKAPPLYLQKVSDDASFTAMDIGAFHGKTVVVEFWATWCVPCISEIPVINSLAARADSSKVQFLSITDEDPPVVRGFLKKHPISGLIGIDTSSKVFDRYGVVARPATFVVGPDGRIVSNNISPDKMSVAQLSAIATGAQHSLSEVKNKAMEAKMAGAVSQGMKQQFREAGLNNPKNTLYSISISRATGSDAHAYFLGSGSYRLLNMNIPSLTELALSTSAARITTDPRVDKTTNYNLNVEAPSSNEAELHSSVEAAIASATGTRIAHHVDAEDVLLLEAASGLPEHTADRTEGLAAFSRKQATVTLIRAKGAQIATLVESVLELPAAVNGEMPGTCSASFSAHQGDYQSMQLSLIKYCNVTLRHSKGNVDRIVIRPRAHQP